MTIRKRASGALLLGTATVVALATGGTPAAATDALWTVTPGGAFSGSAAATVITDSTTGTAISCVSSRIKGTFKTGTGLPGPRLAKIPTIAFHTCTVGVITFTVSPGATPWFFNALTFTAAGGGVTKGTVTGIHLNLAGSNGCSAVVDGTGATAANGMVKNHYNNTGHHLELHATQANLHFYAVSGCGAQSGSPLASTDRAALANPKYAISPVQTITSP
jgi:hypothetical protein